MTPTSAAEPLVYRAGPKSKALFEEEQRFIAPGLQSIALFSQLAMESGRGVHLRDADGREYLDFVAGVGVASVGYAHPEWVRVMQEHDRARTRWELAQLVHDVVARAAAAHPVPRIDGPTDRSQVGASA